jgi:Rrf2 family nitric oxide-sensitive transcriptional repressor
MKISRHTDYSLRVLVYLDLHRDKNVTIKEIEEAFATPRNHLVKVVHRLAKRGYIRTRRGKGGGMRLARASDQISLRDVVWDMEPNFELMDCDNPGCPISGSCVFKTALAEARESFLAALDKFSVAQMCHDRSRLRTLLGIAAA